MSSTGIICLSENLAPFGSGYWGEHGLAFYIESGDISIPFGRDQLEKYCRLMIRPGPVDLSDSISTTGEIERITQYETPQPDLLVERDGMPVTDTVRDDQSLVIHSCGETLLLCGCCHAGIVNTMESVKRRYGDYPAFVAGGLHLEKADTGRLSSTTETLRAAGVARVLSGHCSGDAIRPCLSSAGIVAGRLAAGMRIQ